MRSPLALTAATAAAVVALTAPALAAGPADRNHDKLPDHWERANGLSLALRQTWRDQDNDGVANLSEFRAHTRARLADSDRDGRTDADEDYDRDGVDNGTESDIRLHPGDKDTDNDRVPDGREDPDKDGLNNAAEDRTGNDPMNPDTDGDGIKDGDENAGTVKSFENGWLTISMPDGSTLRGRVTDETAIACVTENPDDDEAPDDQDAASLAAGPEDADDADEYGDEGPPPPPRGERRPGGPGGPEGSGGPPGPEGQGGQQGPEGRPAGPRGGRDGHRPGCHSDRECTTEALTPGAAINDALLQVRQGGAWFAFVAVVAPLPSPQNPAVG
jgi:hypothetical protein